MDVYVQLRKAAASIDEALAARGKRGKLRTITTAAEDVRDALESLAGHIAEEMEHE